VGGSEARSTWIILALSALAVALLALSFVPWATQPRSDAIAVAAAPATPTNQPATPVAPTRSPAEIGRALFGLKGCATCHRHDGLMAKRLTNDSQGVPILAGASGAPDLTRYQPDPDFLRTWLKDPKAVRPNTQMPNLRLREEEIEALIAFLQTNSVE
jgi:mono/diheme cytochrome c family protein